MSIANVSNRWLNRLYKILAIMLVLLAVLISAFRLFLPYVEHYRQDLQDYINNSNQTHIIIGGLGMSWQRSGPTLIANRVTLVDTTDAYVYINHLEIQVDFWETLSLQRLISSNLILDGAVVTLKENAWKTANDNSSNVPVKTDEQLDGFQQVSDIFLNRINQFSLVNSRISLENNSLERRFRVNNLKWLNSDDRHQAQGNIIFDGLSSNNLSLKIDLQGQSVDELNGLMYVEANHLDITPWLDSVLAIDSANTKTDIGFSAWSKVNNGSITRIQFSLHDNRISWRENTLNSDNLGEGQHTLTLSPGQLLLVKAKETAGFTLFSTPMLLQFNQQAVQEYVVQASKTAEDFSLYLSSFDLALISQVSPLFIGSKNTRKLLSDLDVKGQATDIFFKKNTDDIQALARFTNTSTKYSQGIPGIENLSGNLSLAQSRLHIDIKAEQGKLDFSQNFVAPIPYQSLQASVDLSVLDQGWQLQVHDALLTSEELNLSADLAIDALADTPMSMALLANISDGDASKAGHYYPLNLMSEGLTNYLNESLIDGKIKQAQVLINGPLNRFPYEDKSGAFVVDAEVEDVTFKFSNDWPAIKRFDANLNFTNNSMLITGRAGELSGLDVNGVQAAIDNLGEGSILTVDTLIKPSLASNVANLMVKSPFENSVGSVLEQLQIGGNIKGEFHLNLPLNDTGKALASGEIQFDNNTIALQTPRMDFSKVNGQLRFENEKIETQNFSLNWQGLPLDLKVKTSDKTDYYDTNIALTAHWNKDLWLPHLSPNLTKYFDGQIQLQGDLSLYHHHGGGFSYQFLIDSNLEQLALELPEPYQKAVQMKVPLKIEVNGQLERSTFTASYGEQLSFFGVLAHDTRHFSQAHIVLGNEKMLLPMNGFHITTNLEQASVDAWQPFISDIIQTASSDNSTKTSEKTQEGNTVESSKMPLFSTPERIRGTISQLNILGQRLHNVSFNLLDKTNWWLLQLNATETRSQIKFFPDWLVQGIDVNADFIQLNSQSGVNSTKEEVEKSIEPLSKNVFATIPKINFHCDRCQVDDINLGKVDFLLDRENEHSIKITNFRAKREQAELNFSGQWHKVDASSTTNVKGALSLNNIEYELEQLGYGSIIRDSGGTLAFDLDWLGGPHEFNFANLNGELNAAVDDGYLAEVSDKARIFSVLSLQSIVRKLTFDFRDIFSDGMFYKDIKGDYHIQKGVLYTDNTRMNGSAGDLFIKGNTSFVDSTIDYKMSYKPNLTSSLPVLAWIATLNPVVFLAGVAIDQVITSQVVSEFNFELTGSVNDPNFREVNRKSRDVSVGRSKPPEFVDSTNSSNALPQEEINTKSFKEFNTPDAIELDLNKNDIFNDNKLKEDLNDG